MVFFNFGAYCLLVVYYPILVTTGLFGWKPPRQYRQHILAPGVQNWTPDVCARKVYASIQTTHETSNIFLVYYWGEWIIKIELLVSTLGWWSKFLTIKYNMVIWCTAKRQNMRWSCTYSFLFFFLDDCYFISHSSLLYNDNIFR